MKKIKIFIGNVMTNADDEANAWIEKHPNIEIIDVEFELARYRDHAVCITYEEK